MRIDTLKLITLLIILAFQGPATCCGADETFDLRSPSTLQGSTVRDYNHFLLGPAEATLTMAGREAHSTMTIVGTTLDDETVVRLSKGQLVDYKDHVLLKVGSDSFEAGGGPDVEIENDALEGSTIQFTRNDNTWSRQLLDHAPSSDEKKALDQLSDPTDDSIAYPLERVSIGRSWMVSGDTLKALMGGGPLHLVGGYAQLTFAGVSEIKGDSCAVVDLTLHATVRMEMGDGKDLGAAFVGTGRILRSLRTGLERQSWIRGETVFGGQWATENGTMDATIRGPFLMTGTNRLVGSGE